MLLSKLRQEVLQANLELVQRGLVLFTFGNASGIDRQQGLVVIKPSGVPYSEMKESDLVVTDLEGNIVEGECRPSSDLPTHLVLYKASADIGGVTHTHSEYATAWAQACEPIPCLGTTHADYFYGPVPVTGVMSADEVESEYERNTGYAITRAFEGLDYGDIPAVLVANHGPFTWGKDVAAAAHNAVVLESIARMAYYTRSLSPKIAPLGRHLHDKHYLRKHGRSAYYGQPAK